jgi:hypothetical protein
LRFLDQVKALQEKPAPKLLSGLTARPILNARTVNHDRTSQAYRRAIYKNIRAALEGMPFQVIENDLKSSNAGSELLSRSLVIGQIQGVMDPTLTQNGGTLSSDMAHGSPICASP